MELKMFKWQSICLFRKVCIFSEKFIGNILYYSLHYVISYYFLLNFNSICKAWIKYLYFESALFFSVCVNIIFLLFLKAVIFGTYKMCIIEKVA